MRAGEGRGGERRVKQTDWWLPWKGRERQKAAITRDSDGALEKGAIVCFLCHELSKS